MRISRDEIAKIKGSVDCLAYAEHLGIDLKRVGSRFRAHCPFHEDGTPSFYIHPESQSFYCFGCGKHGDVITLARELKNLSFSQALEDIASHGGTSNQQQSVTAHPKPGSDRKDYDITDLEPVVAQYHQSLASNKKAREYLASRGISDKTVGHFEIGYCDGNSLPKESGLSEKLLNIGLLNKYGQEYYLGRITIPVRNQSGKLSQLYGRRIQDGPVNHFYLRTTHTTVFNPGALNNRELHLCESIIDTLTLYSHGIENVCGIYGTHSFRDSYVKDLMKSGVEKVIIAYDNDEAGNIAAVKTAQRLRESGIDSDRMNLPSGFDVNSYFCKIIPYQEP